MGDFEDVERLQAGIRSWLLRSVRSGRHELRDARGSAVLSLLCAAAFGPALGETGLAGMAGMAMVVLDADRGSNAHPAAVGWLRWF